MVIQSPTTFGINSWWHFLGLVGFKTIQLGDQIYIKPPTINDDGQWVTINSGHFLIGSDAWILKNSWGNYSWGGGDNGFGYVVANWSDLYGIYSISGITSLRYTNDSIICEDRDGDGYYYWGTGPKPATCPCDAPDEPDGDDSDPSLGPMDAYGYCMPIALIDIVTISQTWNTNKIINRDIIIPSGVTLRVTDTAYFSTYTVIVRCGGKLVIDGGTIDDGNIIVRDGGELTISNNGKVLLGNYDNLDVQLGAVFNLDYGEILLK